jgi:hypothetical protein
MNSGAGDTTQLVPGYPIRTPWDHSSVDSSPRPIAASHVLHRPLVPRHPPSALDNLTTKMLASTMHISTNNQPTPTSPTHPPATNQPMRKTPRRAWPHQPPPNPATHSGRAPARGRCPKPQPHGLLTHGLLPQDPTGCFPAAPATPGRRSPPHPPRARRKNPPHPGPDVAVLDNPARGRRRLRQRLHPRAPPTRHSRAAGPHPVLRRMALLRKEVIQPHLPVRLPCYDFVPIASPTFDRSLPEGLGHGLRVLPTFVT